MNFQNQYNNTTALMPYERQPYHYDSQNDTNEYQSRQDTLQLMTSPTDAMYNNRSSLWNPSISPITANDMDYEELNQPERGIAGFVSKLYQCLQAPDDGQKYARWCKHNGIDMFIIDCIPKFTETVLPKLFKHCKFASFVRQLNIYGFQRDTDARKSKDSKDKETCRWHHIYFRPGRRDLFHLIRRKTPRYSRRKRQRIEDDDPETIINVSGDESDIKDYQDDERESMNSFGNRCHSSCSSTSTSASPLQHLTHPSSLNESNLQLQQQQQQQQQEINFSQLSYFNHTPGTAKVSLSYPQPISPSTSSLMDEQSFCQFQLNTNADSNNSGKLVLSNQLINNEGVHNDSLIKEENNSNGNTNDLLQYQQTMAETEDQLRSQIVQLRKGYTRMYNILTGEVNKAFSLIDVQRSRIEFLESTLQQQELKLKSPPFIGNPNFFPTVSSQQPIDFLQIHTAPTTPIYHQAFSNNENNEPFLSYDETIIASPHFNNNDNLQALSPCIVPSNQQLSEKWLSSFNQQIVQNTASDVEAPIA